MANQQNKEKLVKFAKLGRFIRLSVTILCAILLLGYALSPIIVEQAIRYNLPEDVILQEFEGDLPGFSQIGISDLALDMGGNLVRLRNLSVSYDLKDISLESLSIKLAEGIAENGDDATKLFSREQLNVPSFILVELANLNRLKRIAIDHVELEDKHQHFIFENTQLLKINENNFQIITHKVADDGSEKFESLPITLSLLTDNSTNFEMNVSIDDFKLANISYLTQRDRVQLKLELTSFSLLNKLELLDKTIPFSDESSLELDWSSDLSQEQSVLELNGRLNPLKSILDSLDIELSLGAIDSYPLITNIKLTATKQEDITMSGFIDVKAPINVMFDSRPLNFQNMQLNFETRINETLSDTSSIILIHPKTRLVIEGLSIAPTEGLAAEARKLSLVSTSEQIGLKTHTEYNANFDLLSILGDTFSLHNYVDIEEITGTFAQTGNGDGEKLNFSSMAKSQFIFFKTNNSPVTTTGQLSLENLILEQLDYYIESEFNFSWKNIEQSLSSGKIQSSLVGENAIINKTSIDSFSSDAEFDLDGDKINGIGNLVLNGKTVSPFTLSFDKKNFNLSAQFNNNKLDPQILNPFLSAFGKQNKLELGILSGLGQQSTAVSFNDALALTSSLIIEDLLVSFGENTINGLNIKQEITSINPLKFDLELSIDEVNFTSGLLISNIRSDITSTSSDSIIINNLSADIFEGVLLFDLIEVEKNVVQPSLMKLSKLSLTELIFFMDVAGLYADGLLDLELPLALKGESLIVENGKFATQKPGILKYTTGELKPGDDENIGLQALRNFHYQSLDGNLSYDEKGYYRIKLHLLGSNPDLYGGYPIDFVVNLNGELSGIFRSLFLTGNFEEAVIEQAKTGQVD